VPFLSDILETVGWADWVLDITQSVHSEALRTSTVPPLKLWISGSDESFSLATGQLLGQGTSAVDMAQRLEDATGIHLNGAADAIVIDEVPRE
jgi:hypothetical protein